MDSSIERFIPHTADPYEEIAVEHLQRYHSVLNLVNEKVVLDAGSGEGYGAHLMSKTAARVIGVDISGEAVAHASAKYSKNNLTFRSGSIDALPFVDRTFDVVVCFEVIEHVNEPLQNAFLREARRVLKPDGVLVISTPNKAVYADLSKQHNQFHKREFYIEEFTAFLQQVFPNLALFAQGWFLSSILEKPNSPHLVNLGIASQGSFSPKYVVALCGADDSVNQIDLSTTVIDRTAKLEGLWARIQDLQTEIREKNAWACGLESNLGNAGARIEELQTEVQEKNAWAAALNAEVQEKNSWAATLNAELDAARGRIADLQAEIAGMKELMRGLTLARTELELIKQSNFWKMATRYYHWRNDLLPLGSRRRRFFGCVLSRIMPEMHKKATGIIGDNSSALHPASREEVQTPDMRAGEPNQYAKLEFTASERPRLSIIIPVFNQWHYTYACLQSIQREVHGLAYEILLADDGSVDRTARAEDVIPGVRVLRDGTNRGFLRNCNHAAAHARGEYIYFVNNDTELKPGAIHALLSLLDSDASIGLTGSKLVYPDGRIQEAGGIIWSDASGWNYGRGQDASLPEFNYVKEVDYLSGASFMTSKRLWNEIGGFDERYAPAYCEDSDFAFEVRRRGKRVVYQPHSVVVHHEGVSHGTEVSSGIKARQVRNEEILKSKWSSVLAGQFANGQDVFHARDRSAGKRTILIIDHYVPHFDRDAGSRTIWAFIQAFLGMGLNVKFLGDNFFPHQPYTEKLEQSGVEVLVGPWYADQWPEWLAQNGRHIDHVLLSRPHIAPKYITSVRRHSSATIFFYVHDLHYLREEQIARIKNDASLLRQAKKTKAEEQTLMNQMDVIFSCSDIEASILKELCPKVKVLHVPPYSVTINAASEFDISKRNGILFVGNFGHPPNSDGILWFMCEIWPSVRNRIPGVVFTIAGADPPAEIKALESDAVKVPGFVNDMCLKKLYDSSRLVAIPLRYGAGVKGKTVEAMANGVPFVSTASGVEGMPGIDAILDPAQIRGNMADNIVALYQDSARLSRIAHSGCTYVAEHFSLPRIQESFAKAIPFPFRAAEGN
jgi:O-antigen biosynthesis protein